MARTINPSHLDDGEGIEATLQQQKAKWHDSCRLEFNKNKLQHAEKRERPREDDADGSKRFTCQSVRETSTSIETCFFCGKLAPAGGPLCKASIFRVDVHVRQCALKLQGKRLLAKLSAGDLFAQMPSTMCSARYPCTIEQEKQKHLKSLMWTQ